MLECKKMLLLETKGKNGLSRGFSFEWFRLHFVLVFFQKIGDNG